MQGDRYGIALVDAEHWTRGLEGMSGYRIAPHEHGVAIRHGNIARFGVQVKRWVGAAGGAHDTHGRCRSERRCATAEQGDCRRQRGQCFFDPLKSICFHY